MSGLYVFQNLNQLSSDPHGHNNVAIAILTVWSLIRTQLAGGLGVLKLEPYIAGVDHLEKFQQVLRVEADHHRIAGVGGFN